MPKIIKKRLARAATKKGMTGKRKARYVYGAMNNMGLMQGNKETMKGKMMDEKEMEKGGKMQKMQDMKRGAKVGRKPRHA